MTDLLAIGAAGVRAFQAALVQVGDNVANADTPGYVRRTLQLATAGSGAGSPTASDRSGGAGVIVGQINRASDALAVNGARVAAGDHARFGVRTEWLERLQAVVTNSDLDARIGGFFDAGTDLAAAPTSTAARTIFIDRTDQVTSAFRGLASGLGRLADDLASATAAATGRINAVTAAIGVVNGELRRTSAGGAAANGLRDNRDQLLADLASEVRISVTEGARGEAIVRLGSGSAAALLVDATGNATRVGVRDGASGAEVILDPTHAAIAVQLPSSGALAGLIEATRQVTATQVRIDALATRFGTDTNTWHQAGSDALGDAGAALVATRGLTIAAGRANAGTANVDIAMADDQLLSDTGYRLVRDAAGWTLSRLDGSASISGIATLVLDGITVQPGNGAREGDSWDIGVVGGAAGLALRQVDPARIATADRFLTDSSAANTGDGQVTVTPDVLAAGFLAPPPYRIDVTGPGTGIISDIGTNTVLAAVAFDGSAIAGAGFQFSLTGTPAIGDTFRILGTGANSNDNGNILALGTERDAVGTDGRMEASLDASIASIGSQLAESRRLTATALAVRTDAALAVDSVSGVDLDREAAELTRLQVAYRANAQVMIAARDLFDTILGVFR